MITAVRNFWVRIGVLLGAVIFAFTLAGAPSAAAAPLAQGDTGTITGQVLSLDDVPLPGVRLAAFAQAPSTPNRTPLAEFRSDAQGRYSVQVPAGEVWVEFLTQDILGQSFWGYSNLPVTVAAGQTVTGQDFRVAIRVVSEPQAPVTTPPVTPPPGMPATGAGQGSLLPLAGAFSLLLVLAGLVQRRRATR